MVCSINSLLEPVKYEGKSAICSVCSSVLNKNQIGPAYLSRNTAGKFVPTYLARCPKCNQINIIREDT